MNFLNLLASMAIGFVMTYYGITIKDWGFWVIICCSVAIKVIEHYSK